MTFMPSLMAASATRRPIAPSPMMPRVRPRQLDAGISSSCRPRPACACPRRRRCSAADKLHRRHDVARRHQHAGHDQFLDRIGIGARRVEHRHAALAHLCHRNVVGARAGPADGPHAGRNLHLVHVVRAHQDRIRLRNCRRRLRNWPAGRRFRPRLRDLVERQDAGRLLAILASAKSFMKSTSACTPSIGMAL